MIFSGVPLASLAATPGVYSGAAVGLHGPYLDQVKFTVITSDSTLSSSLTSNTIQGPEWQFSVGSYISLATNANLYTNSTTSYTFEGIAFNMLHNVINNTNYRRAIQALTNYGDIESIVLDGVAGSAQPDMLPCNVYPTACNQAAFSGVTYDLGTAVDDLIAAGLTCWNTQSNGSLTPCTNSDFSRNTAWTYGPSYGSTLNGTTFEPLFYFRADDVLRSGVATRLVYAADQIGLILNSKGIYKAGGIIYVASLNAVISGGTYNATTGGNNPPVFNYTYANSGSDAWDMYTFGWITSPNFLWPWSFFNSQNVINTENFINFYNQTMDKDTNSLFYAPDAASAESAAQTVAVDFAQNIPYVMSYYLNDLYSVYLTGWTGYADYASTGPMTSFGLYFSLLNLHPSGQATGGVYNYALHESADPTGLNPLYNTNWIWQADIWGEIYDGVLSVDPTRPTTAQAYIGWETNNYSITSFSGPVGSGSGWFLFQPNLGAAPQNTVGQVITLNLYNNMTFFDHVPVTAYDVNYSLWATNLVAGLNNSATPFTGALAGSAGLLATYIPPSNPYQIQIYINSTSFWNLGNIIVPIFPQHIWKYFNANEIAGPSVAIDTTQTFAVAADGCALAEGTSCLAGSLTDSTVPLWLQDLNNLEISNGPYWLQSFDPSTGVGALNKNVNYYRAAWWAGAPSVSAGTPYNFVATIGENIFNSGSSTLDGVAAGSTGFAPVTNATGTVTAWSGSTLVGSANLTGGTGGNYTAAFDTTMWAPGTYELVVNATYNFLGLQRTWWQAAGVTVAGPTTGTTTSTTPTTTTTGTTSTTATSPTTSTTSTSPPTTSVDYTPYIYGGIVVVIIIIIAVALARRRGGGGT